MNEAPSIARREVPHAWLAVARTICDIAIGALLTAIVLTILIRQPVYVEGLKLLRYERDPLLVFLLVRIALTIPWRSFLASEWKDRIMLVAAGILCTIMVSETVLTSGWPAATERPIVDQMAFGMLTPEEIREDVARAHILYPDPRFVELVEKTIPESTDSRILYLGDQRPLIWAYMLYPRKLYSTPELQTLLSAAVQRSWEWTGIDDPLREKETPLILPADPRLEVPSPKALGDLKRIVAAHEIEWVVYYDSAWPDRRFIHRIVPSDFEPESE